MKKNVANIKFMFRIKENSSTITIKAIISNDFSDIELIASKIRAKIKDHIH